MADDSDAKKVRRLKKPVTVREKSKQASKDSKKVRRLSLANSAVARPAKQAKNFLTKEYHLPLPDNKFGKWLGKKAYITPKFLRNSFQELKQVQWPNTKATVNLSVAVFIFAIFFGLIVSVVDFGLERVFKELIIK